MLYTNTYELISSIDYGQDLVKAIASMIDLFNVENIAIGHTVDGYDVIDKAKISVTITESADIHDAFLTRALRIPNVTGVFHD